MTFLAVSAPARRVLEEWTKFDQKREHRLLTTNCLNDMLYRIVHCHRQLPGAIWVLSRLVMIMQGSDKISGEAWVAYMSTQHRRLSIFRSAIVQ